MEHPAPEPARRRGAPRIRVGIDIGGTFTDLVLTDEASGPTHIGKVLTTPRDPAQGTLAGFRHILERAGVPASRVEEVIHATTLAANALIERAGAPAGLITTQGFTDVLEIAREKRHDLYDLFLEVPAPLIPAGRRLGVRERVSEEGRVVEPVDEAGAAEGARRLRDMGVQSVAVAFLHAPANPANEEAAEAAIRRACPGLWVSRSSVVAPETGEYERSSTTAANAYVQPLVDRYLDRLLRELRGAGFAGELRIMLSNGGFAGVDGVRRVPVRIVESGPAGGALAAAQVARRGGERRAIGFDMGGTTAKICLVEGGEPATVTAFEVARTSRFQKGSGLPILAPTVDLAEIGAGGGSIARVNAVGLLEVGPRSAGAEPGPACYGRGGTEPTVTDASLVLGYLNPDYFLGGEMRLDAGAAREAVAALGRRLGLGAEEAAWGIYEIVTEQMAAAARVHIAEKGGDPREYALIATGGAGPLHACHMARKLYVGRVIVPPAVGVASAVGLLLARPRADAARAYVADLEAVDWARARALFEEMALQARDALGIAAGEGGGWAYHLAAEVRYKGQVHSVRVPIPGNGHLPEAAPGALRERFEEAYLARYRRKIGGVAVEVAAWRLTLLGPEPGAGRVPVPAAPSVPPLKGRRRMFGGPAAGFAEGAVYDRYALPVGGEFAGPAVIEERESTVAVPAGASFRMDASGNILIEWG